MIEELVPRTCSRVSARGLDGDQMIDSKPLEHYREHPAYILIGAPGAGKTVSFQHEVKSLDNAEYIAVRDFITLDDPGWPDKVLFIDGLDEMRAGVPDGRTAIDQVRAKLQQLGCPRFRLSCRATYWMGANDKEKLEQLGHNVLLLEFDPLTKEDSLKVLRSHDKPKNGDPAIFIKQVDEHGLDALIENPQSLLLLADSIGEHGDWPASRKEVYERACKTLLTESNEEHLLSGTHRSDIDALMDAAGRLCAVQLLTGNAGFTLPLGSPNKDYPELAEILSGDQVTQIADTLIFPLEEDHTRIVPVHRHIAEFLGARHLAGQVDRGFSVNRILALMAGSDSVVVPSFQCLAAWFAVYSHRARTKLIETNPLEITLHGDVESFDTDERRRLLIKLKEKADENPWFVGVLGRNVQLRGLISHDLLEDVHEILTCPTHNASEQSFLYVVLKALHSGSATPEFSNALMKIIRDEGAWPANKSLALDIFIKSQPSETNTTELEKLLANIQGESIKDFQGELLNTLLVKLYPEYVTGEKVLDYFINSTQLSVADFEAFWANHLVRHTPPEQLADLLDILVHKVRERLEPKHSIDSRLSRNDFKLFRVFLSILAAFVPLAPKNKIDLDRIRHWLETAWLPELRQTVRSSHEKAARAVNQWLQTQPDAQQEVFKRGVLEWIVDGNGFKITKYNTQGWRFGSKPDPDFWPWCLDLALRTQDPEAAKFFLNQYASELFEIETNIKLSLDDIETRLQQSPALKKAFKGMRVCELYDDYFTYMEQQLRRRAADHHEQERERRDWINLVREHEEDIRKNQGPAELLHRLALAYFGIFFYVDGDQPQERIRNLLNDDPQLVQLVLDAFRKSITRQDVPSVAETFRLAKQRQIHPLALPCLAGLKETGTPPSTAEQIRCVLALHYRANESPLDNETPEWYRTLLAHRPNIVSEILVRQVRFQMRQRERHLTDSYELAYSDDHAKVAYRATLNLLKSFPIRCTVEQLFDLRHLLVAALLHCKQKDLKNLLKDKLADQKTKHMDTGQHVCWLAARFLTSPKIHHRQLESHLKGYERRTRHFVEFICRGESPKWIGRLAGPGREHLIRLIGSSFGHMPLDDKIDLSSISWLASCRVRTLIDRLGDDATPNATETLQRLINDPGLSKWSTYLKDAADRQRSIRRKTNFDHCSVEEVIDALDGGSPANVDDLVAILLDNLDEIALKIRNGNTDDWHQYWNQIGTIDQWSPKYENDCRDALLSDLIERLRPLGIRPRREASHANSTRADIQITYKELSLPIEIKRSHSGELWTGIKNQLIPYTRDPDANRRGIYLVFWFGVECGRQPDTGIRPTDPDTLKTQLENTLSPEEAQKISILVIDVSRP